MNLSTLSDEELLALSDQTRPSTDLSALSDEQLLAMAGDQPKKSSSFFDSRIARMLFPGVGGALGTAAGTTLGAAAGGVGAVPGAFVGSTTGAGMGESARQFLASLTGGGPQSMAESVRDVGNNALIEATGPVIGKAAKMIPALAKRTVAVGGNMVTGISPEATMRALERGPSKVVREQFFEAGVPQPLRTKVSAALKSYKQQEFQAYEQARKAFEPEFESAVVNPTGILKSFKDNLYNSGFLDPQGAIKEPFLPPEIAKKTLQTNNRLQGILKSMSSYSNGIPAKKLEQLRRELDDLLEFDPNSVKEISEKGQGVLMALRTSIKEALDEAIPGLQPANERYHTFHSLYDVAQRKLTDERIEPTLRNLMSQKNTYNLRTLSGIDQALPEEKQFLDQVLDFTAGTEFGKRPYLRRLIGIGVGASRGNPLAALGFILGTSPRNFGTALKVGERIGKPIAATSSRATNLPGAAQTGSSSVAALLRLLGQPNGSGSN